MAADLKTPADVAEMHALRDDHVTTRTGAVREMERDKVVPTPKHMTAKPAGKFDFDQSGQVHLAPGANAEKAYSLDAPSRGFTAANSRTANLPSSAPSAQVSAAAQTANETTTDSRLQAQLQVPANQAAMAGQQKDEAKKTQVAGYHAAMAKALAITPQWTLSATGELQRSLDSGKNWQRVAVGNGAFRALSAVGTHVWIGGKSGILYHSADSGQSWTQVTPVAGERALQSDITRVDFTDPSTGTISTGDGQTWSTSDAGQTWTQR
jgi:hypothetical protein